MIISTRCWECGCDLFARSVIREEGGALSMLGEKSQGETNGKCKRLKIKRRSMEKDSIGQNKIGDCLVFSYFFKVFYGIFGVYIFPKWLINDS